MLNYSTIVVVCTVAFLTACISPPSSDGGSVGSIDVSKQPRGVLTSSLTQKLWTAYETVGTCQYHPTYIEDHSLSVSTRSAEAFASETWINPFSPNGSAKSGGASIPDDAPPSLGAVVLDERYGERNQSVDQAARWFVVTNTAILRGTSASNRERVRAVLVEWANSGALSRGIRVSWGTQPVDWQVMTLISSIVATTASLATEMTAEERASVGPWLNGLVRDVASSRWDTRQDNKVYMAAYISMVWGYMVADLATVQKSVEVAKLAVHDMRPDGSFPKDSMRGGMGLKYASDSLGYLIMISALVKENSGLDLYSYDAEGRSLHNAVAFMIQGIQSPSVTNQKYALSCPDSGDRWGSVTSPNLGFRDNANYLAVYAAHNPSSRHAGFIRSSYGNGMARSSEVFGAPPGLLFR